MKYEANSLEEYMKELPEERRMVIYKLREVIYENLPSGFEEVLGYGMIGYVVPHSLYPEGYHCNPKDPLPFMNVASQKNFIALYHMGIYGDKELLEWFITEYTKVVTIKIDMGKSCIRFKKMDQIPYELIAELCKKMTPAQWIEKYERMKNRENT
ncbi:MAG: DUF1801 domain-containing protein [Vallitaleaceae bacterium]|nr:DUF1801 domain-containing protein [Vallitaleaceae bacterium]